MKRNTIILVAILFMYGKLLAQVEPGASKWKTWFISSGKNYRLPAPPSYKSEIAEVIKAQKKLDADDIQQILYWNAGAPGYRWHELMAKLWVYDTTYNGSLANLLLGTAIYDATIAAWDTKYAYNRPRPFAADKSIKAYVPDPRSPSYPCEHSVAAGVAVTIFSKFYPALADSVHYLAQQAMASRIAAGAAFPSDTRDGFELGKKIAEKEIAHTNDFGPKMKWDGKMPQEPGIWRGQNPMFPLAGQCKTVVLESGSQFRPGPPPDFAKEMEELKNYKHTYRSRSNAFLYSSDVWGDLLHKKILEYNVHLNPPRAARLYAAAAVGVYDGFIACWDAKYTYWGIRPHQYDTSYKSLLPAPPFPGYPSGHAALGAVMGELLSYFFPAEQAFFQKKIKEGAESRFQAGIHFRSDNDVAVDLGKKVANVVIQKVATDGADDESKFAGTKKSQ
ncbi:MAG TPA: phosphatase PAP2 family protein [Flavisolibacter sp.]|nr:phosphatase PAP2 family protein [Flavisolibacter sp.]